MIYDMSQALVDELRKLTIITETKSRADFEETITPVESIIDGALWASTAKELEAVETTSALGYYTVYTIVDLRIKEDKNVNKYLKYRGRKYKFVSSLDWSDYNAYGAVAEEVKESLS